MSSCSGVSGVPVLEFCGRTACWRCPGDHKGWQRLAAAHVPRLPTPSRVPSRCPEHLLLDGGLVAHRDGNCPQDRIRCRGPGELCRPDGQVSLRAWADLYALHRRAGAGRRSMGGLTTGTLESIRRELCTMRGTSMALENRLNVMDTDRNLMRLAERLRGRTLRRPEAESHPGMASIRERSGT